MRIVKYSVLVVSLLGNA